VPSIEAINMGTSIKENVPVKTNSDERLLADYVQSASTPALGALVERHSAMVYSTCLRILGNVQLAEDASQATFLVFVR
jgi:DNA-directed RNA polymerase specialized sigma24 family protein